MVPTRVYAITGRFEFLHRANLAWIIKAKAVSRTHEIILRLFPGADSWAVPDYATRKNFLLKFDFGLNIIPYSQKTQSTVLEIGRPDNSETENLIGSFIQEHRFIHFQARGPDPLLHEIRDSGRVVTINGCFDILHPGHLALLEKARSLGDSLAVLINSDASVKGYKGSTRPIHSQYFRAALLNQLPFVDHVIIFPEDNPLKLLEQLQPDIHVKGGSVIASRVEAEQRLLKKWNGRLVSLPMLGNFSTSDILAHYPAPPFPC